jgi:hypothetical protein
VPDIYRAFAGIDGSIFLTVDLPGGRIARMFGRKREKKSSEAQPETAQPQVVSSGGYLSTELPTFHGRTRKVVVYTSDGTGKIIKTFKKR